MDLVRLSSNAATQADTQHTPGVQENFMKITHTRDLLLINQDVRKVWDNDTRSVLT